jgi:hypothetical protein
MSYNPYDLITITFNGQSGLYARPIELDSEIVDHNKMTNAAGELAKPKTFVTTCPTCGDGVQFEADVYQPYHVDYTCEYYCDRCPIKTKPSVNPFRTVDIDLNPVVSETIEPINDDDHHSFEKNDVPIENKELLETLSNITDESLEVVMTTPMPSETLSQPVEEKVEPSVPSDVAMPSEPQEADQKYDTKLTAESEDDKKKPKKSKKSE